MNTRNINVTEDWDNTTVGHGDLDDDAQVQDEMLRDIRLRVIR